MKDDRLGQLCLVEVALDAEDAVPGPLIDVEDVEILAPELVAKTIAGISLIGHARDALVEAGWDATITANRISVGGLIEAQLATSNGHAWWHVYAVDATPPVWIVGAQADDSGWVSCVE